MPRKESYELQIKKSMKAAGIYDRKFDFQIRVCANSMRILDRLMDELGESDIFIETFSKGDVHMELHPLIAAIQKQNTIVTEQLTTLGLNFRAKASNVKESVNVKEDNGLRDLMADFMKEG